MSHAHARTVEDESQLGGRTPKATLTGLAPTPVKEFGTVWNVTPTCDPTAGAVTQTAGDTAGDNAVPVVSASAISDVLHESNRLRRSNDCGTIRGCCQRVRGTDDGGDGAASQQ